MRALPRVDSRTRSNRDTRISRWKAGCIERCTSGLGRGPLEKDPQHGNPASGLPVLGLFHTTGESLPRRAAKYRPLVPVLREMVLREDTPLGGDVKEMIARQLDKAAGRLAVITGEDGGAEVPDGWGR